MTIMSRLSLIKLVSTTKKCLFLRLLWTLKTYFEMYIHVLVDHEALTTFVFAHFSLYNNKNY